ncbi:SE1561 family protein [Thalassobacillus hwangdonensis]|uniref:SE1561 family protein n=1 Tax=Thalassobacillus hwangdonensis TaxID=546108 RepID=A0ABW3L6E3_9BACI
MSQQDKLQDLKLRLAAFMNRIETMDPEETSVEDIDQLIEMLEDLEKKM